MFNLKTWDGFSELPKTELDLLLDTTPLNKKLADRRNSPYRMRTGAFPMPLGASPQQQEDIANQYGKRFVAEMEKQSWTLKSKLRFWNTGRFRFDLVTRTLLLDAHEWWARGIFATVPKPMRIELPPSLVKQDPEHRASLAEVLRDTGTRPGSRGSRLGTINLLRGRR